VYDWATPAGTPVDGREIRSDIARASALPCSETAVLQYTEDLVKQRSGQSHEARQDAAAVADESFTPAMQDEKNKFAIILLSPQLYPETETFAPDTTTTTTTTTTTATIETCPSSANWVVRVYIHPDSKYYKQFCKNPQDEEGGASDICHNARVHGIKVRGPLVRARKRLLVPRGATLH
jgi:hypothetical protein